MKFQINFALEQKAVMNIIGPKQVIRRLLGGKKLPIPGHTVLVFHDKIAAWPRGKNHLDYSGKKRYRCTLSHPR